MFERILFYDFVNSKFVLAVEFLYLQESQFTNNIYRQTNWIRSPPIKMISVKDLPLHVRDKLASFSHGYSTFSPLENGRFSLITMMLPKLPGVSPESRVDIV